MKMTVATASRATFGAFGESAGRTRVGTAQIAAEIALKTAPRGKRVGVLIRSPSLRAAASLGEHIRRPSYPAAACPSMVDRGRQSVISVARTDEGIPVRIRTSPLAVAVLLAALTNAPSPASAAATPAIVAAPSSPAIGEVTTITASGLGGLESATFGIDDPSAGAFSGDGAETGATTAAVPVSDGSAVVEFTPTRSGDIVVAVGTGESVLAEVTVSVSAASAEPAPTSGSSTPTATPATTGADDSAQAEPDSEAEAGRFAFVLIPLIAAAIIVVGGVIVISRGRRRRRGD